MDRVDARRSALGQRLAGRYRLLRLIGHDEGAVVYEAEDERLQRRVAVKVTDGLDDDDLAGALDGGEHDGDAFAVLPLADASVPGRPAVVGDDAPTELIAVPRDDTAVLPVPLVPTPDAAPPSPAPSRTARVVRSAAGALWARRALLVAGAAILVILLLFGLTGGDGGPTTSVSSTVPVTAAPTTTVAPTTTSPPTTKPEPAPRKGHGEGRGKKDD